MDAHEAPETRDSLVNHHPAARAGSKPAPTGRPFAAAGPEQRNSAVTPLGATAGQPVPAPSAMLGRPDAGLAPPPARAHVESRQNDAAAESRGAWPPPQRLTAAESDVVAAYMQWAAGEQRRVADAWRRFVTEHQRNSPYAPTHPHTPGARESGATATVVTPAAAGAAAATMVQPSAVATAAAPTTASPGSRAGAAVDHGYGDGDGDGDSYHFRRRRPAPLYVPPAKLAPAAAPPGRLPAAPPPPPPCPDPGMRCRRRTSGLPAAAASAGCR